MIFLLFVNNSFAYEYFNEKNYKEVLKEGCNKEDRENGVCNEDLKIDFDQNSRKPEKVIDPNSLKKHISKIVYSGKVVRTLNEDCINRTIKSSGSIVILNRDVYNCKIFAKAINFPLYKNQKISGKFVADNIVINGSKIIGDAEFIGNTIIGPFSEIKNPDDNKTYHWKFSPSLVNVAGNITPLNDSQIKIGIGLLNNVIFEDDKRYYPKMVLKENDKIFKENNNKFILK